MSTKKFTFVINNYSSTAEEEVRNFGKNPDVVAYLCYGLEEAPTTGTPHIQGYVRLKFKTRVHLIHQRLNGILGSLPTSLARASFHQADGSDKANKAYCWKTRPQDDSPNEFVWESATQTQGKRTDLEEVAALVQSRAPLSTVAREFPVPFMKFSNGIARFAAVSQIPRSAMPEVYYFYGPTGTGKSKMASELAEALGCEPYWSGTNFKWFQGYEQQKVAIFDDFRGDYCKFTDLLRLLDRYPLTVELKGCSAQFNSPVIILTSAKPPWEVYQGVTTERLDQFYRRIKSTVHFATANEHFVVPTNGPAVQFVTGFGGDPPPPPVPFDLGWLRVNSPTFRESAPSPEPVPPPPNLRTPVSPEVLQSLSQRSLTGSTSPVSMSVSDVSQARASVPPSKRGKFASTPEEAIHHFVSGDQRFSRFLDDYYDEFSGN